MLHDWYYIVYRLILINKIIVYIIVNSSQIFKCVYIVENEMRYSIAVKSL